MTKKPAIQTPLRIGAAAKRETRTQFGALCYRRAKSKKSGFEVLLVSSRDTGRWIIPKGWPVDGETPAAAAAMEAWEEAGVRGRAHETCIGHFSYHKWIDEELSLPCIVGVFPVEVLRLDDDYPEAQERKRKWFSPKKAAQRLSEPELRQIVQSFDPARLPG
ncbi:NUDIX hydrolase [Roseibacterium sp. SDUM158016]|uniref:NUDIX hydrolase n=1 Tax=Roseicyclus sediminis TaxID=2980997 RepID=UPI0021D38E91|nr:NUDIX hydrolase [Roseibacterium sp. SDUM158016]MCU4653688.1 NUDIX hydrolase [Roseibacterium sp. SDUM158016]